MDSRNNHCRRLRILSSLYKRRRKTEPQSASFTKRNQPPASLMKRIQRTTAFSQRDQPNAALPGQPFTALPSQPNTALPSQPTTALPGHPNTALPSQPTTALPGHPNTALQQRDQPNESHQIRKRVLVRNNSAIFSTLNS